MIHEGKIRPATGPAKMLGVGTVGGKARTTKVFQKRLTAYRSKKRRVKTLAAAGFKTRNAVRATAMPSIGYGVEAMGVADTPLKKTRKLVLSAASSETAGGCVDAEFFAIDGNKGRLDPAFMCHVAPLSTWAQAWWENWRTHDELTSSFLAAEVRLRKHSPRKNGIWNRVKGPTAAVQLTANRIGWVFLEPHVLLTDEGISLDLKVDPPAAVASAVAEAVVRWRAANVLLQHTATSSLLRNHTTATHPKVLPSFEGSWKRANAMANVRTAPGIFDACNAGRKTSSMPSEWQPKYAPYLVSAVAGKQWAQARCARVENGAWTSDANCQLCKSAVGTLLHRHICPTITPADGRQQCPAPAAQDLIGRSEEQKFLWQTRGIGGSRVFITPRETHEEITWLQHPSGDTPYHQLDWYIDASQIDAGEESAAIRFGVAAVAVNSVGQLEAAVYARPPSYIKSIPAAEAWGLWLVLASTPARRRVFTDCRANLALLQAGRDKASSAKNKAARVWGAIFNALDDSGATNTDWLIWMPAHTSRHQIGVASRSDGQPLSSLDWLANMAVDELAKHAASTCRVEATTRSKLQAAWANARFGAGSAPSPTTLRITTSTKCRPTGRLRRSNIATPWAAQPAPKPIWPPSSPPSAARWMTPGHRIHRSPMRISPEA